MKKDKERLKRLNSFLLYNNSLCIPNMGHLIPISHTILVSTHFEKRFFRAYFLPTPW